MKVLFKKNELFVHFKYIFLMEYHYFYTSNIYLYTRFREEKTREKKKPERVSISLGTIS